MGQEVAGSAALIEDKGERMKKQSWLCALIVCLALVGFAANGDAADMAPLSEPVNIFEGGRLYRSGKIPVLDLHGSWRQMGRQYGGLMAEMLQDLYQRAVVTYFLQEKKLSLEAMTQTAEGLFQFYPQRFKEIVHGMAETSGLSVDQQIRLNALELFGTMSGCSGIFAWGDFTGGKPLVAGRNYDWFDSYADFARNLTVTVFHPESGFATAIVTFAGVIYVTTAMNERGLFLELNNGLPSGGGLSYNNRVPAIANLFAFLVDCGTMAHLDAAFQTTRPNFAFIINVADGRAAYAYEWPPFDLKMRKGASAGLLVATNHFTDPAWGVNLQPHTGFKSVPRRDNLLALGQKFKGQFDAAVMMKVLDTPMDKGGATWPLEGGIRTVYQIVAEPESRALWVNVPGFQDWTPVDLSALFLSGKERTK